jgi:hypothetical protein
MDVTLCGLCLPQILRYIWGRKEVRGVAYLECGLLEILL